VHGRDGVSQKGDAAGNASHYYSLTRMETSGVLDVGGRSFDVQGSSWMDHEFGTSFLEAGQLGWNWFALQLDDDSELMVYEFLRRDGRRDAHSGGTMVGDDGQARGLAAADVRLEPAGETWRSEASGGEYPIAWRVAVPSAGLDVTVRAVLPDQELVTERSGGVAYWEGAVVVDGTKGDRAITGRGYLEMTGYAGRSIAEALQ
jgi:predicted secreted hydrolase